MILKVDKDTSLDNDYISVKYRQLTPAISQIIEVCQEGSQVLLGELDGNKHNIDINDVLYIEWVDNHSCICTENNVFAARQTLVQFEQLLNNKGFVRVSKPMLVNTYKVRWISSGFNMKLLAELINGEKIAISRHYRDSLLNAIYKIGKEVDRK